MVEELIFPAEQLRALSSYALSVWEYIHTLHYIGIYGWYVIKICSSTSNERHFFKQFSTHNKTYNMNKSWN